MTRSLTQPDLKRNQAKAVFSIVVQTLRPAERYDGVRPINIYVLRLVYTLMFFVLGKQTWTHILTYQGAWDPTNAVNWCVWTAFATLAGLGIIRPLPMLPILLLEIFYKVLWLLLVAYPLWSEGTLPGSPAEETTYAFLWVLLPIAAMPWGYAFMHYIYDPGLWFIRPRSTVKPNPEGDKWLIER